jgi:hypothetical protein
MAPQQSPDAYISSILSAFSQAQQYTGAHRARLQNTITEFRLQRQQLLERAREEGLVVIPSNFPSSIDDIFETDDGGKLIDTFFKVQVDSIAAVQHAVAFCKKERLLALPIGAKTSAIGIFEARSLAERFGLKGVVGIVHKKDPLPVEHGKIAIDLVDDHGQSRRVVRAAASVSVQEVNDFLETNIEDPRYRFRIMPDPTSKADAQIGGILATGAEGGNRSQASEDIYSVTVVDAESRVQTLTGADAQRIVGLNGNAGIICEASCIPTAFPKYEHGIVVPLSHCGRGAWHQALALQEVLRPFCFSANTDPRIQEGRGDDGIIVTGIEILATATLALAIGEADDRFSEAVTALVAEKDLLLFITFSSFLSPDDDAIYESAFFKKALAFDLEEASTDDYDNFILSQHSYFDSIRILSSAELSLMDGLRHAAPSHARELARRMGGVSESTDINIRIHGEDLDERRKAVSLIADLYADYAESFSAAEGFRCLPYGHLHPGVGRGGGIDVHIRAIFELSNPGSRYNAPEQVAELKSRQSGLFKKFLKLYGKHGIEICAPEKGKFASAEYWNWLCLHDTETARQDLELCHRLGVALSETGDQLVTIAGRVPHLLPGFFRPSKNGVKGLLEAAPTLDAALLKLAAENPKQEKIRRLLSHVLLRSYEYLGLSDHCYPFFITHPDEAAAILHRNFGSDHACTIVHHSFGPDQDMLEQGIVSANPEVVTVIDLYQVTHRPLALMIVHESMIRAVYDGSRGKENRAVFRNLYDMWALWPFETLESPDVIAIARLGLWFDRQKQEQVYSNRTLPRFSADVIGGIAPALFAHDSWRQHKVSQQDVTEKLRTLLGIPSDYHVGYTSSATEAMQIIADLSAHAHASVRIIQVVNDVASARWNAIFKKAGADVASIIGSWTTAENSELADVTKKIAGLLAAPTSKKSLVVLTPHKTSTTADVHPDHVMKELERLGYRLGRDYYMICDLTSGLGARYYQTLLSPDTGLMRLPFQGFIAGFNRSFGLPAGIACWSFSSVLAQLFGEHMSLVHSMHYQDRYQESFQALQQVLDDNGVRAVSVAASEIAHREKMNLILGWLEKHQDLIALVPNSLDRSPLLIGIFSQAKNMIVAKRLLEEIYGIRLGSGCGPFEREGVRIAVTHLTTEQVLELLASLDQILELDDVIHSRGENIPNIALREPHDPLSVIRRVAYACTIDDLIKDQLGLDWLGRLIQTYNANVSRPDDLVQVGGKVPMLSTGARMKAQIYGESSNIIEMRKILQLRNEETRLDLPFHFKLFKEAEEHLRAKVLGNPDAQWGDKDFVAAIEYLLRKVREHLSEITRLLEKYADKHAARDAQGRIEWPIVA